MYTVSSRIRKNRRHNSAESTETAQFWWNTDPAFHEILNRLSDHLRISPKIYDKQFFMEMRGSACSTDSRYPYTENARNNTVMYGVLQHSNDTFRLLEQVVWFSICHKPEWYSDLLKFQRTMQNIVLLYQRNRTDYVFQIHF